MPVAALKRKFPKQRHHVEPLGNGFYRVESLTAPGEHYDVDVSGLCQAKPEPPTCACKGYQCRGWCSHCDDAIVLHVRRQFQNSITAKATGAEEQTTKTSAPA